MKNFTRFVAFGVLFATFVVLLNSISNGATSIFEAETNLQGRHTGESPAVISMHRIGLGSSDLPSSFHSKSFLMLPKNDADRTGLSQACAVTGNAQPGSQLSYLPLSAADHELLSTLLSLSPSLKRIRVFFNRTNVVLMANIRRNSRTVVAKQASFALACGSLFLEIEKKHKLPKNNHSKNQQS